MHKLQFTNSAICRTILQFLRIEEPDLHLLRSWLSNANNKFRLSGRFEIILLPVVRKLIARKYVSG